MLWSKGSQRLRRGTVHISKWPGFERLNWTPSCSPLWLWEPWCLPKAGCRIREGLGSGNQVSPRVQSPRLKGANPSCRKRLWDLDSAALGHSLPSRFTGQMWPGCNPWGPRQWCPREVMAKLLFRRGLVMVILILSESLMNKMKEGLCPRCWIEQRGPRADWMANWLFSTPWSVAYQVPLSMGFSRQEYLSGYPLPSPGDLPDPRI